MSAARCGRRGSVEHSPFDKCALLKMVPQPLPAFVCRSLGTGRVANKRQVLFSGRPCTPPSVATASVCTGNTLSGSTCSVGCNSGYYKSGGNPTCTSGAWSTLPSCVGAVYGGGNGKEKQLLKTEGMPRPPDFLFVLHLPVRSPPFTYAPMYQSV